MKKYIKYFKIGMLLLYGILRDCCKKSVLVGTKGNKELMGGKSYNVATKWLKTIKVFNVKTIDEISEKLRGGF